MIVLVVEVVVAAVVKRGWWKLEGMVVAVKRVKDGDVKLVGVGVVP